MIDSYGLKPAYVCVSFRFILRCGYIDDSKCGYDLRSGGAIVEDFKLYNIARGRRETRWSPWLDFDYLNVESCPFLTNDKCNALLGSFNIYLSGLCPL
jgi:hypothetical protein